MDEKTASQALGRSDGVLLPPVQAERHRFEYYWHGTLALYSACNMQIEGTIGKTASRHASEQFGAFLRDIVAHQPAGQKVHVIADNLSAHKTKRAQEFLSEQPRCTCNARKTYSCWLN